MRALPRSMHKRRWRLLAALLVGLSLALRPRRVRSGSGAGEAVAEQLRPEPKRGPRWQWWKP